MMCKGYDAYELISTVDLGIATPLSIRSDAPIFNNQLYFIVKFVAI